MDGEVRDIVTFIRSLLSAAANVTLYSTRHPQVARLVDAAFRSVTAAVADRGEVSLLAIEGEIVVNDLPLPPGLVLSRFAELLTAKGIGNLRIFQGVTAHEVMTLVTALSHRRPGADELESCPHLIVGRIEIRLEHEEDTGDKVAVQLPNMQQEELAQFLDLYEGIKRKKRLKVSGMIHIVSRMVEAFRQEETALLQLASLRTTDDYTFTHSTNVCILNIAQATAMGIEGEELHDIGIAAMLHDIGKLFVPEEILTKKGKLSSEEFAVIQQHPVLGARHLLKCPGVPHLAVITAYEHHMKYNGNGYPAAPPGWQPNLCSQMTMLSDFFDALRTKRPYREPMELQDIARMMMDLSGTDFNPLLTRNFLIILQRLMGSGSPSETL